MADLPYVAWCLIANVLPRPDVLRARQVCRAWRSHFSLAITRAPLSSTLDVAACTRAYMDLKLMSSHTCQLHAAVSAALPTAPGTALGCTFCQLARLSQQARLSGSQLTVDSALPACCHAPGSTGWLWSTQHQQNTPFVDYNSRPPAQPVTPASTQAATLHHLTLQPTQQPPLEPFYRLSKDSATALHWEELLLPLAQHYPALQSLHLTPNSAGDQLMLHACEPLLANSRPPAHITAPRSSLRVLSHLGLTLQDLRCSVIQDPVRLDVPLPEGLPGGQLRPHDVAGHRAALALLRDSMQQAHDTEETSITSPSSSSSSSSSSPPTLQTAHTQLPLLPLLLTFLPNLRTLAVSHQGYSSSSHKWASVTDLSEPWTAASLGLLTQLTSLQLQLFVPEPNHLQPLSRLTGLTHLSLHFGHEWWISAEDLTAALSSLSALSSFELSLDYGVSEDELADELHTDAVEKDDWGTLLSGLPALRQCTLRLRHTRPATVLGHLSRYQPLGDSTGGAGNQPQQHNSSTTSVNCPTVTLHLQDPLHDTDLTLSPSVSHLTHLHLHATGSEGVIMTPDNVAQLAAMTSLKVLHLALTLTPGLEPSGVRVWPSVEQLEERFHSLWRDLWPGRACPDAGTRSIPDACDWPGNPLRMLATLKQLRALVLHVGNPMHLWQQTGSTRTSHYERRETGDWFDLHGEGALEGNGGHGDWEDEDEDGPRGGEGPWGNVDAWLAHPPARAWVTQSDSGASHAMPIRSSDRSSSSAGGYDGAARRVNALAVQCSGVTDGVLSAWLGTMRCLEQLSVSGCGWLAPASASSRPAAAGAGAAAATGTAADIHTVQDTAVADGDSDGGVSSELGLAALGRHKWLRSVHLALLGADNGGSAASHHNSTGQHQAADRQRHQPPLDTVAGSVAIPQQGVRRGAVGSVSEEISRGLERSSLSVTGTSFEYLGATPVWFQGCARHTPDGPRVPSLAQQLETMGRYLTVSPTNLPAKLEALELHNVRYSRDWEHDSLTAALPRVQQLTLTNTVPMIPLLNASAPDHSTTPAVAGTSAEVPAGSSEPAVQYQTPVTSLSNWHLKYVVGRLPMLSKVVLHDTLDTPGGDWAEHPSSGKLKSRGVAQLGNLNYLNHLELQVAHRMGWQAQEALASTLVHLPSLRTLTLGASNLFKETHPLLHGLTQLTELRLQPTYQLTAADMETALHDIRRSLPLCSVQLLQR